MHSKGNHKQNEKTTHRMGENFANESTDKGLSSKIYKHPPQTAQYQKKKNKQPHPKMGRRSKQTILQQRHMDGQKTHEKMFNITHH